MALNCAIDIILMRKFQTGVRFHYSVSGLQQMRDQMHQQTEKNMGQLEINVVKFNLYVVP